MAIVATTAAILVHVTLIVHMVLHVIQMELVLELVRDLVAMVHVAVLVLLDLVVA